MILEMVQYGAGALLIIAALFAAAAGIGLMRFPDVFTRMHAASKAGALGTGGIFLVIALVSVDLSIALRALFGLFFVLLTSPLAAHLLARAALRSGTRPGKMTSINEFPSDD